MRNNSPSFSATLLNEIYRSIDGEQSRGTPMAKAQVEQKKKKTKGDRGEYVLKLRRTCLVDEWMELERRATQPPQSLDIDDLLSFCFTSFSSSDSGYSGFSSSNSDSVYRTTKQRDSCFPPINSKNKPVRTALASPKSDSRALFLERMKLDGYCTTEEDKTGLGSKSKVLRMYADLKKAKLPISPGGKFTSFINSIFTGRTGRKAADASPVAAMNDFKSPNSCLSSTCSSASSFTRSCLVKKTPSGRDEEPNHVKKKSVRFYPPSIEHSVEIRSRNVEHSQRYTSWRKDRNLKFSSVEVNREIHELTREEEEDDIDDGASDTSSELFEIDHLVFAGISNNKGILQEELPVFETTCVNRTNRAICNGRIMS